MVLHERDTMLAAASPNNFGEPMVIDLFGVHAIDEEVRASGPPAARPPPQALTSRTHLQGYHRQPWLYEGCPMEEEELVMYDFSRLGISR